jgi:DNA topoisomerase-1
MLEQWGIGRPSTYAPILSTIRERGYVTRDKGSFQPTDLGFVVNDLLNQHFADIVDIKFTASMEDELDDIVNRSRDWVSVIQNFYTPFARDLQNASQLMEKVKLPDEFTGELCPQCGKALVIKTGRFGKFVACSGYPECRFTKPLGIGVKCPQCDGELVEKRSRKGRIFYGCGNYPKCQFATNFRPLPRPCPECGGMLTAGRGRWAQCTKCKYRGKLQDD